MLSAPADTSETVSVRPADRLSGRMTPWAPAPSALRRIAPRVLRILDLIQQNEERRLAGRRQDGLEGVERFWGTAWPRRPDDAAPSYPGTCLGTKR